MTAHTPNGRPRTCGVYAIRHVLSGRRYVGSAVKISRRWERHLYELRRKTHKNPYLQNAWNKYGEDAFEFVVLEECVPERLIEREQHYIDQCSNRYNIALTAGSSLGVPHTPEAKAKLSAALSGRKKSPETRAKMSAWQIGRTKSTETRAKISASQKARWDRKRAEDVPASENPATGPTQISEVP